MSAAVTTNLAAHEAPDAAEAVSPGRSKRSFFGLGKKKKENAEKSKELAPTTQSAENTPKIVSERAPQLPALTSVPPMNASLPVPASMSKRTASPPRARSPKSPSRSLQSSGSPVLSPRPNTAPYSPSPPRLSTSSSMIFERNVQEHPHDPNLPVPVSPAIPAHIQTENHIPPVLEASSLAITDRNCGVDEVEIVTHSAHQPAVSVVVPPNSHSFDPVDSVSIHSGDDASAYGAGIGAAAAADKRRLSFISFADVVQAEQAGHLGEVLTHSTPSPSRGSPVQSAVDPVAISTINERLRRSPSPIRLGTSPPQASYMTGERSPGSPGRSADNLGVERSELTIETMRQALRKTGSGDLGQSSPTFSRTAS